MALTVTNQLTTIIDCDDDTNWSGSDASIGLDTDIYYEPTGSIAHDLDAETYYATYTWGADQDFTDVAVYWWYLNMTAANLDTWANGGIGLRLEDGAGNWSEWWVGGKDTYKGGWRRFVVYTGSTPDDQSATAPTMTAIRKLHIRGKATAKSKLTDNVFIDYIQKGNDGIKVTGGTTGDKDFDELVTQDESVYAGVVRKANGVFYIGGPVQFGDASSGDINFLDTSQVVMTEDTYRSFTTAFRTTAESLVSSTHYTVSVVGNAAGSIIFQLGSKSGDSGISGCFLKSQESAAAGRKLILTATDANIDELKLYGCTFYDAGTISLPADATGREVLSCNFEACDVVLADTCIVKYCKFISADDAGVRMSSTTHNITDSDFISCPYGVRITVTGTFTFDALIFTGTATADIDNTSGGAVTVQNTNGSNASTYTGDTTIETTVTLEVTVKDKDLNPIQGASVYIEDASDQTQLMNELTNASGIASETYNYPGSDVSINVRIRKSSSGSIKYLPIATSGTITSDGYTLTAIMYEDTIVS